MRNGLLETILPEKAEEDERHLPFMQEVLSTPLSERPGTLQDKKPLLRKIAAQIGVPQDAIDRKKKAMQYGSGVHKILVKNIKQIEEELAIREELRARKREAHLFAIETLCLQKLVLCFKGL
jgi:asparagine synthetase B (glutamine-hydrolysing)